MDGRDEEKLGWGLGNYAEESVRRKVDACVECDKWLEGGREVVVDRRLVFGFGADG